jgi:hypothetical protein
MQTHCLVLPVNLLVGVIEGVRAAHFKNGQVPAEGGPCIRDVGKADAGLRNHERICWRRRDSLCNVGLEVNDAGVCEVDVAAPTRDHRVWFDSGVTVSLKEAQEGFTHFMQGEWFACSGVTYEGVAATFIAAGFAAGFHVWFWVQKKSHIGALFADKPFLFEEGQSVMFRWELFDIVGTMN